MFTKYFEVARKQLIKTKTGQSAKAKTQGKTAAKSGKTAAPAVDVRALIKMMEGVVPPVLSVGSLGVVDSSGYSPEGIDFIAYRPLCRDMATLMDGCVPLELVYGTYHVCGNIGKENLQEALSRVVQAKKLNLFTEDKQEVPIIPSFIICSGGSMSLKDVKSSILDYYVSKSLDHALEFDILMVLDRGIVVKNWREKRSFIALETGAATLMWFFILMHEYLDMERGQNLDLRSYVKYAEKYAEY